MASIEPTSQVLGATVRGVDLSEPLTDSTFARIVDALGRYGVLCFPGQRLESQHLKAFSKRFGSLQTSVTGKFADQTCPEVGLLSNIIEDGEPIGLADAGQDWHTDMSYNQLIGFTNVLYGIKIPHRDGRPLGDTKFANMHAAYEDLPDELVERLSGMTGTHDFNKFWDEMRSRPGSNRPALTPEQKAKRPPAVHPLSLTHPITGRKVLYANPGYLIRINEMSEQESDQTIDYLFKHQLQSKYQYTHTWTPGDVLMWDHIGTLHTAIPDYTASEHRLIKRCQVMADRIFEAPFMEEIRRNLLAA
ncbi:TauD/TfdA family dioxygenase [Ottowia caeni]|uniref:TauD/TfdA dioxygenase family protein n=1 Tax=Ottowia caeni TaxID=2870339 RepID=UPI001E36C8D8|nr:TauD/TfdA family dioxygenase [Ottowia caeni]